MAATDNKGRPYAHLSELKPGDLVQVDGDFEGCFLPWSVLEVQQDGDNGLALIHNAPECGACGGDNSEVCFHNLAGQDDGDGNLIGIYRLERSHK